MTGQVRPHRHRWLGAWAAALAVAALVAAAGEAASAQLPPTLPEARPMLQVGSRGPAVASLQRALSWLGWDAGPVDGRFGARTRAAVVAFQRGARLAPDGRVGPATWRRLEESLARSYVVHRVRRGETLYGIARRYGVDAAAVARQNGIADPDLIRAGSTLVIRLRAGKAGSSQKAVAGKPKAGSQPGSAAGGASGAGEQRAGASGSGGAEARAAQPSTARGGTAAAASTAARGASAGAAGAGADSLASGTAATSPTAGKPSVPVPIALTFNDGPDATVTPALLDVLARHGVRATFFVVGSLAERHPDVVRRMAQEGHEVESHGYVHRALAGLPVDEIRSDLSRASQVIARLTGRRPIYFRPPEAAADGQVVMAAQAEGVRILLWTNIGAEHRPDVPVEEMVDRLVRAAHPGAVFMLHADLPGTPQLVDALLRELARRRIHALPLGELLRAAAR